MGKSGSRKKKGGSNHASVDSNSTPSANGGIDLDASIFLKRARELKEEGNRRFQIKDYVGALEQYNNALKLTPKTHPDRAVFHSNRAACLMQVKPNTKLQVLIQLGKLNASHFAAEYTTVEMTLMLALLVLVNAVVQLTTVTRTWLPLIW